ncbi:hypothetical protein JYU34_000644 [Plutella xylostella]|uniref:Endonuclease/exonuclease/phosphatase domain-containing protein n=1 Tax=Plutella xylostella TaxID=51655 RepID=A0ABQ7R894_PLUXY|nr:hypothetical protein JYU34_000644 [Plutella xylostella]
MNTGQDELLVSVEKFKPDILALNETWMKEGQDIVCAPKIPGYILKLSPRPNDQRRGASASISGADCALAWSRTQPPHWSSCGWRCACRAPGLWPSAPPTGLTHLTVPASARETHWMP